MITNADLQTRTRRDLADAAREIGVTGVHSMRKEELIDAIRKAQKNSSPKGSSPKSSSSKSASAKSTTVKSASKSPAAKPIPSKANVKKDAGAKKSGSSAKVGAKAAEAGVSSTSKGASVKSKASRRGKSAASATGNSSAAATSGKSTKTKATSAVADKRSVGSTARNKRVSDASKASKSLKPTKASAELTSASKVSSSRGAKSEGQTGKTPAKGKSAASRAPKSAPRPPTAPKIVKVLRKQQAEAESRKDLSACVRVRGQVNGVETTEAKDRSDRIVLIVRDSYWLQASWEIARASIERARAAMGTEWHAAEPILRLVEVAHGSTVNSAEQVVRDIPIHGGVNNWYIDVDNPPNRFRVMIGYRAKTGKFHTLCRSNIVQTPAPGACDPIEGHWSDIAEDYERIYSLSENENGTGSNDLREMFEERLQRPMIDLSNENFVGGGDFPFRRERDFPFEVDAELIVYGSTTPGATVSLGGKPVRLGADGSFTVRMELPDKRQVIPVVACSRDGMRQRTTVVAVERNTKVMEPVSRANLE